MRKPLVAGNWKMNGSSEMLERLVSPLTDNWADGDRVDVALFPPAPYLAEVIRRVNGTGIGVGGQNSAEHRSGAFTGEISSEMLSDIGCNFVLVGHSERRALYAESNEVIAEKFALATEAGLVPVLCVGETLGEREANVTEAVVTEQLDAVSRRVGLHALCAAVIAYEPVWAIGTGKTASPEQAQWVHAHIRGVLGAAASDTRILYGGSVKATNAAELFAQPDIDGGLVGGASLDAEEFLKIAEAAK